MDGDNIRAPSGLFLFFLNWIDLQCVATCAAS